MLGIQEIASYIPSGRSSNYAKKELFEIDDAFIEDKIGVKQVAVKDSQEDTSDLCVKAFNKLQQKTGLNTSDVECVIVVTQNPDTNIPHTSAIIHGQLGLPEQCACFDISLGCSGFVYGLSIIQSLMESNSFTKGLLFTADPYSKIINANDKNTALLFGDAATVTLISNNPVLITGKFNMGTIGKDNKELICNNNELSMNGRAIFNFAARYVPADIKALLEKNNKQMEDIDVFIFHQGSKYIVDTLTKRLNLPKDKVPFDIMNYGNTVSSSIPIIIEQKLQDKSYTNIVISGFGVGLSWASTILTRLN
ncbi:ketoacyl-ACP synthase III [Rhodocytophaga rosea]|uniref:Ketoacyl-ACP synthase III n=1 Tax=Rhodocytophaga rosea TaxID=2704465 RepID=A0A6C0GPQ0_9BACT|nr:ketoacyl-ACP synthase III [Rhodocytophaga rosea]QHT69583.1 ketoacyl-ACP synthase III [Rhodocytophaga rosea]